jgi:hypothetical protein
MVDRKTMGCTHGYLEVKSFQDHAFGLSYMWMTAKWSNLSITAGETRGKRVDAGQWNDPERVELF